MAAIALSTVAHQSTVRADEPAPAAKLISKPPDTSNGRGTLVSKTLHPNSLSGHVANEKGEPITGAEVLLFRFNVATRAQNLIGQQSTDAEGRFRFQQVFDVAKDFPEGVTWPWNPSETEFVRMHVRARGYATDSRREIRQRIAKFGTEYNDVKLAPAATLSGQVTGPDGKPVGGAFVSVDPLGDHILEGGLSTRTNPDGTYEINDAASFDIKKLQLGYDSRLCVDHPAFAYKCTSYETIPGSQGVKLEAAAIIEGRVVYGDSKKPAAGARVFAAKPDDFRTPYSGHFASVQTDGNGKYRFTTLPAGDYGLSAEMSDWVNVGIDKFPAIAGTTATAQDLNLIKGRIISIRLIDVKTDKPLDVKTGVRADFGSYFSRPRILHCRVLRFNALPNSQGRFEMRSPPGKRSVYLGFVRRDGENIWIAAKSDGSSKSIFGNTQPQLVDVAEDKDVRMDVPVVELKDHPEKLLDAP
jgi:protocatechuate 3,4-dioxygenase beta subunit